MQKSPLQYGEIIFQSKVFPLFLPKCSKFHHSEMYTIYMVYRIPYMVNTVDFFTLYGIHCVGEDKKNLAKTWRNEVDTKNSKNSNFRDSFLNIEKEFYHNIVKDFGE